MVPPLRIGLVGQDWAPSPGGVEAHCALLARELVGLGCEVRALALERGDGPPWSVRDTRVDGVPVRRVRRDDRGEGALDGAGGPRAEAALAAWVRRERPDLVHVHHLSGWGTGVLPRLARLGVPSVLTLHDHWSLCPRGQSFRDDGEACERPVPGRCAACLGGAGCAGTPPGRGDRERAERERAVQERLERARRDLQHVGACLVPSESVARAHARAGLALPAPRVLEPGVDAARLRSEVRRLREAAAGGASDAVDGRAPRGSRGRRHLGVLGSVQPSKGVLELARAVVAGPRDDLVLDVHGPRGDYHGSRAYVDALERLARGSDRIRLHGPYAARDTARVLATLDGVAVPSLWEEAYGLGAREARAVDLPVIASDLGGLRGLAGDPGATLVPARDEAAWARVLAEHPLVPVPAPGGGPLDVSSVARELLRLYVRRTDAHATSRGPGDPAVRAA